MSIDWSKYNVPIGSEETEVSEEVVETSQPQGQIDWSAYDVKEEPGFLRSAAKEGARHISRTGSRVGESVLGAPGDMVQFVKWLDSKMPTPPSFLQRDRNFLQEKGAQFLENLPTSSELKEKMSEITEGYTDPQGAIETFGDDVSQLATILMFGKDPTKIQNILGSLAKSTAAKGAAKGAEAFGAGPKTQAAAELGTLFLAGILESPTASAAISDKYDKARALIPKDTMIETKKLTEKLGALESELSKGISTNTKNQVRNSVSELRAKVSGGAYPVEELVDTYHDINEIMSSKKLFTELSKPERTKLGARYNQFKNVVSKELNQYGKSNPEFLENWRAANEAQFAVHKSRGVTNFLESHIGKLPSSLGKGLALELFLGHPKAALATGASAAGLKTGELMYRVTKSPVLTKHYADVVKSASSQNLPATINALNKLDKGLQESFATE